MVYNTSPTTNKYGIPQMPLTRMTIGDVLKFQRNVMLPKTRGLRGKNDPGTSAVGRYQFVSGTLEDRARQVLGPNYKNAIFNEATQDALFRSHYAWAVKHGRVGQEWTSQG